MSNLTSSDLTFPMLEYGKNETPWDLAPLLYSGGAAAKVKTVRSEIMSGTFGDPLLERSELVNRLHDCLTDDLAGGGSRFSANNKIGALRKFFQWVDQCERPLSIDTVVEAYLRWAEHLLQRHRVDGYLTALSLYDIASLTATMLDRVLGRSSTLLYSTRIRKPRGKAKMSSGCADKQSLEDSFAFGHFLTDICESLSYEATTGRLPVLVSLRSGQQQEFWCKSRQSTRRKNLSNPRAIKTIARNVELRSSDTSIGTRHSVVNLRIEAELLMFIAQTGLNLSQAHKLRMDQFNYTSHLDGYQVRTYKNRRGGEVLFEVFSSYRDWFERYIEWRNAWFPDDCDGLLFPLVRLGGRLALEAPQFTALGRTCAELGVEIADSTPSGHPAHQHPATYSTVIRPGSRSAATQVCIVSLKSLPPSISSHACASIRPSVRSYMRCAPAGRGSHRPRSDRRSVHAICPPASG